MRRYGDTSNNVVIPGPSVGLKLTMQPTMQSCKPNPQVLFWFSDATGGFTEVSEAAYLGVAESAGPVLAVAKLLGETCGQVEWATTWTPDAGTGGDPATVENGADLYVYPATGGGPGQLSVSAQCAGRTFGPILLTLLPAAGGGGDCCPDPQAGSIRTRRFSGNVLVLILLSGRVDDDVQITWSVDWSDGAEPDDWLFFAPTGSRQGTLIVWGGDETTEFAATASVSWPCDGATQTRELEWPSIFPTAPE